MRILMTGGAGFIGSWVAECFLKEGHEILIIDNLSTGSRSNIPDGADFIKCDIRDRLKLRKIFGDYKPECINHHAAQINVRTSVEDPVLDADINILGSLNLLELCREHSVKKFIFASTGGAIYGEPENIPADEKTPAMPISPYGTSKYSIEKYLNYFHCVHGLDYVALRYSNVYGPRQNPHGEAGVVAIFCNRIIENKNCIIFGDGTQTRDYIYVTDVAKANVLSISSPSGCYNIGTSHETSVLELVDILSDASGNNIKVEFKEQREGEVQKISLDNKLSKDIFNWVPLIDINQGINQTWQWFSKKSNIL